LTTLTETWRRHHGSTIVSQIESADGGVSWSSSSWLVDKPTVVLRSARTKGLRAAAQTAADYLARQGFNHVCHADACGHWLALPENGGAA
jgi:hypothetical protein